MSDLLHLFMEQEKVATAKAEYNYAGQKLELTKIKMRLAEVKSQHEPLNTLGLDRDVAYKLLMYVVYGKEITNETRD